MNIPDHLHGIAWNILADEAARAHFLCRPSVMLGVVPKPDGNAWCALLGPNLMEGVCGFGPTPNEAMYAFDKAWYEKKP